MKKIDIDGITLRYFPWIGVRFVRYVVCFFAFFVYSYLVFPFRNLTKDRWHAFFLLFLFGVFVIADSSYLTYDITNAMSSTPREYEGVLKEYRGRRGLGTANIIVLSEEIRRFKLLTVRGKGNRENLKSHLGRSIRVRYIVARGLVTKSNLPLQIHSSSGEVIYDYLNHLEWFEHPALPIDRYLIIFFKFYLMFLLIYFPVRLLSFVFDKES